MTENVERGAAFIATGTIAGASFSATVGGIGLVGGFGGVGIGMAPVAAVGGVVGAAAYGAFQGIGKGDAAAYGAIGIGAVSGIGVYSAVGGMGLSVGGTAFGIGMGTMAATGGLIGLAVYGIAKLIDKTGSGETPAQAFTRMEEKVLQMEDYASALMELEEELSGEAWKRKFALLEIEEQLKVLKEKLHSKPRSYFNFTTANLYQLKFRPFPKTEKYATKSPPQKNQGEPKILSLKVQQSEAWKCVQTIEAHSDIINSIAIANDNIIVASASNDRTVSLWNLKTGKRIYSFFGYSKEAYAVAISPDSQILVTGDFDQKVTRWNIQKKELIGTCFYLNSLHSHSGFVYSVVFSPDGKLFASASGDKTIRIWGRFTGKIKRTLHGHSDAVLSLAITPDSKNIVSTSVDKTIVIWNLDSGRIIRVLQGHSGWVTSVAISADSQKIVTGSTDSTIKLWDLHTGELIRTFLGDSEKIFSVAISPDGKTIASSSNKKITIWDLDNGEILQKLSGCYPVAFSPGGKNLVTGGNGNKIKVWQQSFSSDESAKETLLSGEWWEILGVEQNANREDVKRAYRNLAMQYHPDLNHDAAAKVNMQKIVAAYKQYRRK